MEKKRGTEMQHSLSIPSINLKRMRMKKGVWSSPSYRKEASVKQLTLSLMMQCRKMKPVVELKEERKNCNFISNSFKNRNSHYVTPFYCLTNSINKQGQLCKLT